MHNVFTFEFTTQSIRLNLPEITIWRPYRRDDFHMVQMLLNANAYEMFGPFDLTEMM